MAPQDARSSGKIAKLATLTPQNALTEKKSHKRIMSFAKNLKTILEHLEIFDKDRCEYTEDAIAIQNYVIEKLKDNDATFRNAYDGLSLGGSYLDRVKLVTPDEFDLHLKLKFPYEITPKEDENGFVLLYAPGGGGPIVEDGFIRGDCLQGWLCSIFSKVFGTDGLWFFTHDNVRSYILKCISLQRHDCAHTIEALSRDRTISFDMVPAFEFSSTQFLFDIPSIFRHKARLYPWFAVPQKKHGSNDDRTFMICAPHWEREMVKDSNNYKNVLRLMKGLKDKNDLPHLSSYMLKTVMLHKYDSVDWQRDEGSLLLEMWSILVDHLRSGRLDFILAKGHNIFDCMNNNELITCMNNAQTILNQLHESYIQNSFYQLYKLFF